MHKLENNWLVAFATSLGDALTADLQGLSASAAALLLTVEYRQPITTSDAAIILAISQPTATRLADGLVRADLLRRGSRQGRAVPLILTPAGRQKAGELMAALEARAGRLLGVLDDDERRAFVAAMTKMLRAATPSRAGARTICRFCDHDLCREPDCPVGSRASELERDGTC